MSSERTLARLRRFLLLLTVGVCAGIALELAITGHTQSPVQLVPFVLCGLGALTAVLVLFVPNRGSITALRVVMLLSLLGGAFGVFEHLEENVEFAMEIKPAQTQAAPLAAALSGANPPLAPGALGASALIALAAVYAHPAAGASNRRGA